MAVSLDLPQVAIIQLAEAQRNDPWGKRQSTPPPQPEQETSSKQADDPLWPATTAAAHAALADLQQAEPVHQRLAAQVDELCRDYVADMLTGWNLFSTPASVHTLNEIETAGSVLPKYRRLLLRLLAMLVEDRWLNAAGESYIRTSDWQREAPQRRADRLAQEFNAWSNVFRLLADCGSQLGDVLAGRQSALQLLFPQGSSELVETVYRSSPAARFCQHTAAAAVRELLQESMPRPLRVIEIGAGTGGTTAALLPLFEGVACRYDYTDLSPGLLRQAASRFARRGVSFRPFNIEREPQDQDFAEHAYDLVIAADVLHATSDLTATLRHVHKLLAPGGRLLLIEATRPTRFAELTFGLTDGWWSHRDRDVRPEQPLVDAITWQQLLQAVGFAQIALWPHAGQTSPMLDHHVLLATSAVTRLPLPVVPPPRSQHGLNPISAMCWPKFSEFGQSKSIGSSLSKIKESIPSWGSKSCSFCAAASG